VGGGAEDKFKMIRRGEPGWTTGPTTEGQTLARFTPEDKFKMIRRGELIFVCFKTFSMSLKVVVVALISLLCMKTVRSQSDELMIEGQTGTLHLQHTVVAKENWYSIGRLYNLNPKELASYNKLDMTKPLSIGQELQIPLTTANFSQNGVKTAGETLVPLYHIVQEKEWLYRISVNHNKVPVANLEKWNNTNKDQVRAGMHLIVGYLKVKTALSALATKPTGTGKVEGGTVAATTAPAGKAGAETVVAKQGRETPAGAGNESGGSKDTMTHVKTKDTVVHTMMKKEGGTVMPGAGKTEGGTATIGGGKTTTKTEDEAGAVKHDGAKPVSASGKSFNGGYFKNDYSDGSKTASGLAGIFKSTSGWQDGKYYALMNNVPVGTIVRVTGETSGKIIFAKVLGQLPDMKENAGLTIRISNAAASELGEGDGKFNVDVRY